MVKSDDYTLSASEKRMVLAYIIIGFSHLMLGIILGMMQGLEHAGINLYQYVPMLRHYYQGLSMHGTFNAMIFTFTFILAFLNFAVSYGFRRPLHSVPLAWATFWVTVVGIGLVDKALLTNQASVLYTFYAPMQAHPTYYIGLALLVVGTLLSALNYSLTYKAWRRDNPGERIPLIAFGALCTLTMWGLATVGVVVQVLGFLLPWSLGLRDGVDPLLMRTLFWMTGHPLVYFWLLPAYLSWYFILPRLAGGRLFSEPLARLSFLLFIPLSLPVGFHHQFLDPGVSEGSKAIHALITFGVFMPSMITAFTVMASLETGGRARGGKGRLGWIRTLPWGDPAFTLQALSMVLFAMGGVSGLVNASYNVNLVVHNTMFVPGHFHLTVGTAVVLTFMATTYWLIPHLTGRRLFSRRLAVLQGWLWFIGMTIMSRGMAWAGTMGVPRRTALGSSPYILPEWLTAFNWVALGGVLLTVSGLLYFVILLATLLVSPRTEEKVEVPLAKPLLEEQIPWYLDRFAPWIVGTAFLVLVAYGPAILDLISSGTVEIGGFKPY